MIAVCALAAAQAGCSQQHVAIIENFGKKPCQILGLDGPPDTVVPLSDAECEEKQKEAQAAREQRLVDLKAEQRKLQAEQQKREQKPADAATQPIAEEETRKKKDRAGKVLTDCLVSRAQNGPYTSFDGGTSASRLLGDCKVEWDAFDRACKSVPQFAGEPGGCGVQATVFAQVALKVVGK
jgi:hypothetical protein